VRVRVDDRPTLVRPECRPLHSKSVIAFEGLPIEYESQEMEEPVKILRQDTKV